MINTLRTKDQMIKKMEKHANEQGMAIMTDHVFHLTNAYTNDSYVGNYLAKTSSKPSPRKRKKNRMTRQARKRPRGK